MRLWRLVLPCTLSALLVACQPAPSPLNHPWAEDVTNSGQTASFRLTDMNGRVRTAADWHGKVLLLFFGYTHCPEVCPTTLYALSQVMKRLGPSASDVRVLFVTLDPQRDTAGVLRGFVPYFDPHFLGAYADPAMIKNLANTYGVYVRRHETSVPGDYTLDHSAVVYAFDRQGRLRLKMPYGETPAQMASDVRQMLASDNSQ